MSNWFQRRLEGVLDNLIFAGALAVGATVWAIIKTLPGPVIFVVALATFALILFILRVILSFVDRWGKKDINAASSGRKKESTSQIESKSTVLPFPSHEYIADTYIRGRLIYLLDLLAPGSRPIISDRTIEDCEIRGPAMIALLQGVRIAGSTFDGDIESLFVEVTQNRFILGAIGLKNCVFRRCRFIQIGILGTREQIEKAKQGFAPSINSKVDSQP